MDSGINSNFIPHDTALDSGAVSHSGSFVGLFSLVAIVLFVASMVLGAGAFLYQGFLETSNKSKVEQLERAKAAFDPSLILELTRLDERMRDADLILGNHLSLSAFFHMLEEMTLTTVSFRSLNFESSDSQNMTIKMDGVAQSVNSVALQADVFSKSGIITSPIFSNIDRESDGVHFNLNAVLNPSDILYIRAKEKGSETTAPGPDFSPLKLQPKSGGADASTQ